MPTNIETLILQRLDAMDRQRAEGRSDVFDRLEEIEEHLGERIDRLSTAVEKQNGRVGTIERERAEEKGAREALARAAQATQSLRDKSRSWKITVVSAFCLAIGTVVAIAELAVHFLIHH